MKRSYLLSYSNHYGDLSDVRPLLDKMEGIHYWRYELPNTLFLVSELSAEELSDQFMDVFSDKGRFLICEYTDNSQGLLTKRGWALLNDKELPPRKHKARFRKAG